MKNYGLKMKHNMEKFVIIRDHFSHFGLPMNMFFLISICKQRHYDRIIQHFGKTGVFTSAAGVSELICENNAFFAPISGITSKPICKQPELLENMLLLHILIIT